MSLAAPAAPAEPSLPGLLEPVAAAPAPVAPTPAARPERRLVIPPAPFGAIAALERELGVSHPVAQVLVRRGLADPGQARAWLAADEAHPASAFRGIDRAVGTVLGHVAARTRITVHGDYDVDGVCSTAVLVRVLRRLGASVDWYLPSRSEDGYGLSARTVRRLAERGTRLLLTADCAVTAVDEVAQARAAGLDVVVTDHHAPRADGRLPDAPLVHPALCGYPCPELCAAGVAFKLAGALLAAAGRDPAEADEDLDLVALATVCDVVALRGENRRLVRAGLRALGATTKPGLRALMRVARVDPSRLGARALGFRLGPRINAAGRMARADAGLELVLTDDPERAAAIAAELDRVNGERRHEEQRASWAAEAQVAEQGERAGYVLAGEDWHPGVVGIVAGRIAERLHRPTVCVALGAASGTGSARSVPGFDLLAALDACSEHLERHGGHRAAAGLEVAREDLEDFRTAFAEHAEEALTEELRHPVERVDAVVAGDELGLLLAEELETLAPFGNANPDVSLLVPAARLTDVRPMGEGRHVRFTVETGGVRARAVAFGTDGRIPCAADGPVDATFTLELDDYGGAVEPRLVLRHAQPTRPAPIRLVARTAASTGTFLGRALAGLDAPLGPWPAPASGPARPVRDRRGGGVAGTVAALVATGEPVLVVCADAERRLAGLSARLGGFALTTHTALARDPELAAGYAHLVVLDPSPDGRVVAAQGPLVHLAYGAPEVDFALSIHQREYGLRPVLTALYRDLRAAGGAAGEALEAALRGEGRTPELAGRALRVLTELGLVHLDRERGSVSVPNAERTSLERSPTYRAVQQRLEDGRRSLSPPTTDAQAPPRAA